jgi:hypothetical protein
LYGYEFILYLSNDNNEKKNIRRVNIDEFIFNEVRLFSFIEENHQMVLPMTFDMTNFEDVSLYSCTQYDFMKTADEILSSATFADCTIDQNRVILHEIILEGIFLIY